MTGTSFVEANKQGLNKKMDVGPQPSLMYTIVAQVKSNRVVYFTQDPDYRPAMDEDWYFVSSYLGALPKDMSLGNCWRWKFNGGVFFDGSVSEKQESQQETLLANNRRALRRILIEKIEFVRSNYLVPCLFGPEIRTRMVAEAKAIVSQERSSAGSPFLQTYAKARSISLTEAADRILIEDQKTQALLIETESVFQRFDVAIATAKTELELIQVRSELLDEVVPEMTKPFRYSVPNTMPPNFEETLNPTILESEKSCLRAQLRDKINEARRKCVSGYEFDELLFQKKLDLSKEVLAHRGIRPEHLDTTLLEIDMSSKKINLKQAAEDVIAEHLKINRVVTETEVVRARMSTSIGQVKNLREINQVSVEIDKIKNIF